MMRETLALPLQHPEGEGLPYVSPVIAGLRIGEVRHGEDGRLQTYLGSDSVEYLTMRETITMREGAITVDMYEIDGRSDVDYARISIRPAAYFRSANERAHALRFGGTDPRTLVERTPLQRFVSPRQFADIPISGRAHWLSLNPEGVFASGLFDDREASSVNMVATFSEGWTFAWIMEGSRPFVFGELCNPRFIDDSNACPIGEDGIIELNSDSDLADLPAEFQQALSWYMSGEQLRVIPSGRAVTMDGSGAETR